MSQDWAELNGAIHFQDAVEILEKHFRVYQPQVHPSPVQLVSLIRADGRQTDLLTPLQVKYLALHPEAADDVLAGRTPLGWPHGDAV
jgi:hypothetical protein